MTPKQQLEQLRRDLETKNFRDGEAKGMVSSLGEELKSQFKPLMEEITKGLADAAKEAVSSALKDIKIDSPSVEIPRIDIDTSGIEDAIERAISNISIEIPETKLPNIPAPIVNIPESKFEFPDRFYADTELANVSNKNPLAVRLYDMKGEPLMFPQVSSGGGGKADYFTIKGFEQSAFAELTNPDGRIKVELPTGSSGLTDSELRASSVPVAQVSGAIWSTYITDIQASSFSTLQNGDGRLRVSVETGGSSLTDSELRASHLDVQQLSGAVDSVYVTGVAASFFSEVTNPDGRLKVELPSGSSGLTDTELRASSLPVSQVSGASWSTNVLGTVTVDGSGVTQPVSATNLDIRDLDFSTDDVSVYQVSGQSWSTEATQSGTWNIGTVTTVSDITASLKTAIVDSTGVQYSGSNPLPVTVISDPALSDVTDTIGTQQVSGAVDSVFVVGPINQGDAATALRVVIAGNSDSSTVVNSGTLTSITNTITTNQLSGAIDSVFVTGAADSFFTYEARTTNPTAKSDGADIRPKTDKLGRTITRPVQVRDLIKTAYVSLTNGTETTLLAGTAATFNDLIMITATNNSTAATQLDIRCTTAGNIVHTMYLPASTGPVGWSPQVPWPQDATGNNWTIDMSDQTGTTVYVSALFSSEI